MARFYQNRGFNSTAKEILAPNGETFETYKVYPDGRKELISETNRDYHYTTETIKHIDSWYGEGPSLNKYTFNDGNVLYSGIQAEPWSSGPVTFLALYFDAECKNPVPGTLWSEKEIASA